MQHYERVSLSKVDQEAAVDPPQLLDLKVVQKRSQQKTRVQNNNREELGKALLKNKSRFHTYIR